MLLARFYLVEVAHLVSDLFVRLKKALYTNLEIMSIKYFNIIEQPKFISACFII